VCRGQERMDGDDLQASHELLCPSSLRTVLTLAPGDDMLRIVKLGEVLVSEGIITQEQLNIVLARQVQFGGRLGTNLLELRLVSEEKFTNFLSHYFKVPAATSSKIAGISDEILHSIKKDLVEKYKVLPLERQGKRLQIAVLNPNDAGIDELSFATGLGFVPFVISELRLFYELERLYGIRSDRRYIRAVDRFSPDIDVTASPDTMKMALRDAESGDKIADLLLRSAHQVAARVAIFTRRGDKASLWKATGIEIERCETHVDAWPIFAEKTRTAEPLADADRGSGASHQEYYRGPLQERPGNTAWIEALGGRPEDILVLPLTVREKTVAFLYADNGNDSVLDANVGHLSHLASMGSIAFEILTLKEKLTGL